MLRGQVEHGLGPLEVALEAGHDLVGASGFSSVLWADFATLTVSYRFFAAWRGVRVFGAASYFRNGHADQAWVPGPIAGTAQGYAGEVGVEWKLNTVFALQGTADRIEQLGGAVYGGGDLARDIIAVRLVIKAM
jgi:hypothetical protein